MVEKMSAEGLAYFLPKDRTVTLFPREQAEIIAHITALQSEADRLREALEPFAKAADIRLCGQWRDDQAIQPTDVCWHITFGDLRTARAALSATQQDAG